MYGGKIWRKEESSGYLLKFQIGFSTRVLEAATRGLETNESKVTSKCPKRTNGPSKSILSFQVTDYERCGTTCIHIYKKVSQKSAYFT